MIAALKTTATILVAIPRLVRFFPTLRVLQESVVILPRVGPKLRGPCAGTFLTFEGSNPKNLQFKSLFNPILLLFFYRLAEHECDLPEYCDGQTETCPRDVYKVDGIPCKIGKAFCYKGSCRTHTDQCRLLWGPSGKKSDNQCYEQNKKGTRHGNWYVDFSPYGRFDLIGTIQCYQL